MARVLRWRSRRVFFTPAGDQFVKAEGWGSRPTVTVPIALVAILGATHLAAAAPANDNFESAQVLTGSLVQVNGTLVASTRQAGEETSSGGSVWFSWTAPRSGMLSVGADFFSSNWRGRNVLVAQLSGTRSVFSLVPIGSDGDGQIPTLGNVVVSPGVEYFIRIDSRYTETMTPFSLNLTFNPIYRSTVVIKGPATLGRRTKITGRYTNPEDVQQMVIGGSGAGRYVSGRFGNGTFYFYHQRVGRPARPGTFRKATYTVKVKRAGVVIGVTRRTFRVR